MSEAEPPTKAPKGKKGAAKGAKGSKTRKASSARSSSRTRGSKVSRAASPEEPANEEPEDLDRDEREIEAELARMAAEQATAAQISQGMADVQSEQDKAVEYEGSPSHKEKHVHAIEHLEHELQSETDQISQPGENLTAYVQKVAKPSMSSMPGAFSPPPPEESSPPPGRDQPATSASPSGSDKENVPSSALQPKSAAKPPQQQDPAPILSPTKTTRVPLAPSTPNKPSPSKRAQFSPTKHPLGALSTAVPWLPSDIESLLLTSPQPTPGTLAAKLAASAGGLTSPEKGLTVEEWVRWNAGKAEEELRRRCEGLVGIVEGEGMRALGVLGGLDVVG